jgi:hypothetical protein
MTDFCTEFPRENSSHHCARYLIRGFFHISLIISYDKLAFVKRVIQFLNKCRRIEMNSIPYSLGEPERCARRNLRTGLSGVLGSVHSEGERKVRAKVRVRVMVRVRLKEFTLFPKRTSRSVRKFRRAHLSYTQ